MRSAELRQSFLDFFREHEHMVVPSAPLLPTAPNLLFTNAGMNPFVPAFLAEEEPLAPRIADTQKCIRAGGKHNDLEDVGLDTYHHTFFEMLGNWSFGDYFKEEAIRFAWELLTERWRLPPERLYATVYQPGEGEPASFDAEAYGYWETIFREAGLDPTVHIRTGGKEDNFWMMGETGPCGPCSEVHMDLTPAGDSRGELVNADSPLCMEIWNLVFIQFNAAADGSLTDLPARHIDTGMGLERVAGIYATTRGLTDFSRTPSNYDSDLFTDLFAHLEGLCGQSYGGTVPADRDQLAPAELRDCAFRVIADHIRTLAFSIADGILPGNEGRNYVLRRILRRAVLYGKRLQLPDGFFTGMAPVLVEKMGEAFPELRKQQKIIGRVLRAEETAFEKTLDRGLQLFEKEAADGFLSGEEAFALYDTYGFPLDLTELLARERGIEVDTAGFERAMEEQRRKGRAARRSEAIEVVAGEGESTAFAGYEPGALEGFSTTVQGVLPGPRDSQVLVFPSSPFYAEKGGQVGDTGTVSVEGETVRVTDTTAGPNGEILHHVAAPPHDLTAWQGKPAVLSVDRERRLAIQRHHSATHLLSWALRKVLGDHAHQAGSLVAPDHLRFDFTHYEALSEEQIDEVESLMNDAVLANAAVRWFEVPYREKPEDIVAVFGEKYGAVVRVVDIGGFSRELCGGTHVHASGEIGLIKILAESGIAAGTRRIEAVAGKASYRFAEAEFNRVHHLSQRLGCKPEEVEERVDQLLRQRQELDKEVQRLRQQAAAGEIVQAVAEAFPLGEGLRAVVAEVGPAGANELRGMASQAGQQIGEGLVLLGSRQEGKLSVVAYATPAARAAGHTAGDWIRELTAALGGRGGGKPDLAMGGAPDQGQLPEVFQSFRERLRCASPSS
jgi:alanyl-tRNA synthetase